MREKVFEYHYLTKSNALNHQKIAKKKGYKVKLSGKPGSWTLLVTILVK